jgi:conjugal transfer mating pair stabilization protein TraG
MGKYQIVSGTLNGLKQRLGLTGDELFDSEMQDKMAMSLMGNSYTDYQTGKISADQLQNKVSGIWA